MLGVLVFVHELGHFLVAKKCGMKVEQFSLGYPPKAFGVTYGETEYLISWLPLGGYVKIAGMSDFGRADSQGEPWEYLSKPRWMQAAVMVAGVVMNIILAFLLLLTIHVAYGDFPTTLGDVEPESALYDGGIRAGDRVVQINGVGVTNWGEMVDVLSTSLGSRTDLVVDRAGAMISASVELPPDLAQLGIAPAIKPRVGSVLPGRPAEGTGLRIGDLITSVDGQPVATWLQMSKIIQVKPDQTMTIEWIRESDNARMSATVTPRGDEVDGKIVGLIGIGLSQDQERVPVGFGQAISRSGEQLAILTTGIFGFLERLVSGRGSGSELAGPIQIAKMAGERAEAGLASLLSFMAILSVNLAVLNLLPIPMLDGGHLFIMGIEAATRHDLSVKQKEVLQQIGFVFLLALMIYVTANDIGRMIGLSN